MPRIYNGNIGQGVEWEYVESCHALTLRPSDGTEGVLELPEYECYWPWTRFVYDEKRDIQKYGIPEETEITITIEPGVVDIRGNAPVAKDRDVFFSIDEKGLADIIERHGHYLEEDCEGWENMQANLSYFDLEGIDLHGKDLRELVVNGANMKGADLHGANLKAASFGDTILTGADLQGAGLEGAAMPGAILCKAKMQNVVLTNAEMMDAVLDKAVLDNAVLEGSDFTNASMSGASFRWVDLTNILVENASMDQTDLRGATLESGTLEDAATLAGALLDRFPIGLDAEDLERMIWMEAVFELSVTDDGKIRYTLYPGDYEIHPGNYEFWDPLEEEDVQRMLNFVGIRDDPDAADNLDAQGRDDPDDHNGR